MASASAAGTGSASASAAGTGSVSKAPVSKGATGTKSTSSSNIDTNVSIKVVEADEMSKHDLKELKVPYFIVEVPWGRPKVVMVEKFHKAISGTQSLVEYVLVNELKMMIIKDNADFHGTFPLEKWLPFYGFFKENFGDDRRLDLSTDPGKLMKWDADSWCKTYYMKDISRMPTLRQLKQEEREWGAGDCDNDEEEEGGLTEEPTPWQPRDRSYFALSITDATGTEEDERPHFFLVTPYDVKKKVVITKFTHTEITTTFEKVPERGVVVECLRHLMGKSKV